MATIEEKAKAYDEAIEYAHYLMNERCKEGTDGSFHRLDLEKMFPELKESEDERIRKTLIDYFDDANKADENPLQSYGVQTDKALAWLEKQKHDKFIVEHNKFLIDDSYHRGYDKGVKDTLENQSENQKEHNICYTCDYNGSCINPCPAKLIGKQGEQKYNESDDERIRKHLIKHFGNKSKTAWNGMPVDKILDWLERQGEPKPAGWSDTDLICLGYLADFVDKNGDEFYGKNKPNVVKWIHFFANLTTPKQDWDGTEITPPIDSDVCG